MTDLYIRPLTTRIGKVVTKNGVYEAYKPYRSLGSFLFGPKNWTVKGKKSGNYARLIIIILAYDSSLDIHFKKMHYSVVLLWNSTLLLSTL